jgi:hypothetical protein
MKLDRNLVPLDGSVLAEAALAGGGPHRGVHPRPEWPRASGPRERSLVGVRGPTTPILIVRIDAAPVDVPAGAGSAKAASHV